MYECMVTVGRKKYEQICKCTRKFINFETTVKGNVVEFCIDGSVLVNGNYVEFDVVNRGGVKVKWL